MPRAPKDPNAPRKTREKKKETLQYFIEGDQPGTLGTRFSDVDEAIQESAKLGFKKIATVGWAIPTIVKRKIELVPITD